MGLLAFTVLFDSVAVDGVYSNAFSRFMYVVIFSGTVLASTLTGRVKKLAITVVLAWPFIVASDDLLDTSVTGNAEIMDAVGQKIDVF